MNGIVIRTVFVCATLIALGGCAGDAPRATFAEAAVEHTVLDANDSAAVKVVPAAGVVLLGVEAQRLTEEIQQQLAAKQALGGAVGDAGSYDVNVVVTRYEKGNAFARAMLAGLGQIHLDGTVSVFRSGSQDKLSEFTVSKTFAWGGFYGGSTRIEDVEPAFVEGIVTALTGQADASKKKAQEGAGQK